MEAAPGLGQNGCALSLLVGLPDRHLTAQGLAPQEEGGAEARRPELEILLIEEAKELVVVGLSGVDLEENLLSLPVSHAVAASRGLV